MKRTVGCTGKRQITSYREAEETAKRVRRQKDGARVAPYRCKRCGFFHVGDTASQHHGKPRIEQEAT